MKLKTGFTETEACLNFGTGCTNCYYFTSTSTTGITEGMIIYTDSNMTILAPNGQYAGRALPSSIYDTVKTFEVNSGVVSNVTICSTPTPTPTRTPTSTPPPEIIGYNCIDNTCVGTTGPAQFGTLSECLESGCQPTPTPTQTPTNTPTTTNTQTPTNTPTPTPPCMTFTSSGVSLSECSADITRLQIVGWQTGVTFSITSSINVTWSETNMLLGGSLSLSQINTTTAEITVNNLGPNQSTNNTCIGTSISMNLYYTITATPTGLLDCPPKVFEIYYLTP